MSSCCRGRWLRRARVLWRHRLVDLLDDTDPARVGLALLDGPAGLVRVRARWCIGADGARSAVRRELGFPFEGVTDDATFWVADLRGVQGCPKASMAARSATRPSPSLSSWPGRSHPAGGPGAPARTSAQERPLAAAVGPRADPTTGWTGSPATGCITGSPRAFREGSCFLAGDAGHVHSPVGGQGMNTGLQDAHNLALLLADVSQVTAEHCCTWTVTSKNAVRSPVILVKVTDRAVWLHRPAKSGTAVPTRVSGLSAHLAPRLLSTPLGQRIGGYLGQYRIRYHFAPDRRPQPAWATDPAVGLRLPPVGTIT